MKRSGGDPEGFHAGEVLVDLTRIGFRRSDDQTGAYSQSESFRGLMGIGGLDADRETGGGAQVKGFDLIGVSQKNQRIFTFDKKE